MLADLASEISNTARSEVAAVGRPCRLTDVTIVRTILEGFAERRSVLATARAAGVSEGAIRRWLMPNAKPRLTCAALQLAVSAAATPVAAASVAIVEPPAAVKRFEPPPVPAVASPPLPWQGLMHLDALQTRARRDADSSMLQAIQQKLREYGLTALPSRYLPQRVPGGVVAVYLKWCHASGSGTPSEMHLESEAFSWHRARQLTD
jgi:hypothetical protein